MSITHTYDTVIDLTGATDIVLTLSRDVATEELDEVDLPPVLVGQSMTLRWTMDGERHTLRLDDARGLRFDKH